MTDARFAQARHAQPIDTSASHIGFRCVARDHELRSVT